MHEQIHKLLLDIDDFEKLVQTFRLRTESRIRHPELIRTRRPTVKELVEPALVLKGFLENRYFRPGGKIPVQTNDVVYFKHQVGDGLHYIDNRIIRLGDRVVKSASTSECCILKMIHIISARHRVGHLPELWNQVYPDDPLSDADLTAILAIGVYFTDPFIPVALENVLDAAADLRSIKCDELADLFERLVLPKLGRFL